MPYNSWAGKHFLNFFISEELWMANVLLSSKHPSAVLSLPHQLKFEVWTKRAEGAAAGTFDWTVLLRWESILESVTSLSSALAVACGGLPFSQL